MISADTNLLIYAADPDSLYHEAARKFFKSLQEREEEFVVCELVLIELYMQLRNPVVFKSPYSSAEAAGYCRQLKSSPRWRCIDYAPEVSPSLWKWARETQSSFRQIIDARIAFTLQHHGVSQFATANVKDFEEFGFAKVWNPARPTS